MRPTPESDRRRVIQLRNNGLSYRAISRAMRLAESTVHKILKEQLTFVAEVESDSRR